MYDKVFAIFFSVLLLVNLSIFSYAEPLIENTILKKFDSDFYEQIQNKIDSNRLSSAQESISSNYHDVIFVVKKSSDGQNNKYQLTNILQDKGATKINQAKILSFVTASVPLDAISDIAQYDYVSKIGDGQKILELLNHVDGRNHGVYFDNLYDAKEMIDANNLSSDGTGTKIAILDKGIRDNHPDLENKIIQNIACDSNSCIEPNAFLQGSHGTRQAGIIVGSGLSYSQMKGVASNANLFDFYISGDLDIKISNLIHALDYSLFNGANIVNISLGSDVCDDFSTVSIIIDEAIDEGMLVVTAIGNGNGYDQSIPDDSPRIPYVLNTACGTNTISVGALDADGKIWDRQTFSDRNDYSSIGPTYDGRIKPEIVAPGANVYAHDLSDDLYSWSTGTSHAAPFVSGALAVLLDSKEQLSPLEIKSALLLGAQWDPQNIILSTFTASNYDIIAKNTQRTISEEQTYDAINSYGFGILNIGDSLQYTQDSHIIRDSIQSHHYSKDYTVTVTEQKQTKIILSWLKHPINSISNIDESFNYISNLDLELYDSDDNLLQFSNSVIQNNEFIIIPSLSDGDYTIKVIPGLLSVLHDVEFYTIASTEPITPVHSNITPIAVPPTLDFVVDDFVSYPVPLSGIDDGDYLSFYVIDSPDHGTLSIPIRYSDPRGATIHYTPDETFAGSDYFDFVTYDGKESSSPSRITLTGKNLAAGVSVVDYNPAQGRATTKTMIDGAQTISFADAKSEISAIWLDTDNPTVSLFFEASPESSVYVPPNTGRLLTFEQPVLPHNVRVTILDGNEGDSVTVNYVESADITINQPPTADAGENQFVNEGILVTLDATESTDPEGETPLRYQWHQRSGPDVEFIGGGFASSIVSFVAPDVSEQTVLTFELQVKDPHLSSDTDVVSILVNDVIPQSTNNPPKAKAGDDQTIHEGSLVILDGRKSSDPNGDNLTYSWQQTDSTGIIPSLSHLNSAVTSFAAPLVQQDITLTFQLAVSDGTDTDTDYVDVTVSGLSTLPLISNPFPDSNDNFGHSVSGLNDGTMLLVGVPFEDLVEFFDINSNFFNFIPNIYAQNLEEIRSNSTLDEIDYDPKSLDHFIEKGFRIYTLENQYGKYFIPYKTNATDISINYSYVYGNGFIIDVEQQKSYFEMIIPMFFFSDKISLFDDLILFINGTEFSMGQIISGNVFHIKFILNQDANQVELFYPLISEEYSNSIFSTFVFNTPNSIFVDIHPPKKQVEHNISPNKILCNVDLQLIQKQHNNSPACVKENTKNVLLKRGWVLAR